MKRGIIWFKTLAQCDEIIPCYCFDDSHFKISQFGFMKTGAFRVQFLLESLTNLDENLRNICSGLYILHGKPDIEIPKLAEQYDARLVFSKEEVGYEEIQTANKVAAALKSKQVVFHCVQNSTLYREADFPFHLSQTPEIFTSFRKLIEQHCRVPESLKQPSHLPSPSIPPMNLPSMEAFGVERIIADARAVIPFKGGENAGLTRRHDFVYSSKAVATYKQTRNALLGVNNSSKFSAWLSMGCLSAREVYHSIREYESIYKANESTYWLVFELIWRDYFWFMMKKHKHLYFLPGGLKLQSAKATKHNESSFKRWIDGQTGNDFIDANMLELKLSGFMSNRGRQNVASYLCHDLQLDWRYGAAYFEQQLIDYDVSSNWCNWAYIAGVGNDPRTGRAFNIDKQARDYDPDKSYRNLWLNK
jgi:deoxyribodipyrimidine photo-lyase